MKLYILRHGETPWNACLRLQGKSDVELNEKGIALAKETGAALINVPFDFVLTSPLSRARETARLVLGGRNLPIIDEPLIEEISFGEMEGKQLTKEQRNNPGHKFYDFFHAPEIYTPPAGGESLQELCQRTGVFLERLKQKTEWMDKTILVSTHGAASRSILFNIRKPNLSFFWDTGVPKNCAITIIELIDGEWCILEQDVIYYKH